MNRPFVLFSAFAGFALAMLSLRPFRPCSGGHDLERTHHGAFRCKRCPRVFSDFGEGGTMDDGYISPLRRTFDRKHSSVTQESGWRH
jgi:hypothetical protein